MPVGCAEHDAVGKNDRTPRTPLNSFACRSRLVGVGRLLRGRRVVSAVAAAGLRHRLLRRRDAVSDRAEASSWAWIRGLVAIMEISTSYISCTRTLYVSTEHSPPATAGTDYTPPAAAPVLHFAPVPAAAV